MFELFNQPNSVLVLVLVLVFLYFCIFFKRTPAYLSPSDQYAGVSAFFFGACAGARLPRTVCVGTIVRVGALW